MRVKFNGGNLAYLCDVCGKIVYTGWDCPECLRVSPEELKDVPLVCDGCRKKIEEEGKDGDDGQG